MNLDFPSPELLERMDRGRDPLCYPVSADISDPRFLPRVNPLPVAQFPMDTVRLRRYLEHRFPGESDRYKEERLVLRHPRLSLLLNRKHEPSLRTYLQICAFLDAPLGSFLAKGQLGGPVPRP